MEKVSLTNTNYVITIVYFLQGLTFMQFLFDNLFIGIISGIISGVLVSRIFVLQGDFQNQISYFEAILKRIAYARISLEISK